MDTGTVESVPKRWECWECTALPEEHGDRRNCICKVHRPTHAIALLLEPVPADLRVQGGMLSAQLRMGREQVRLAWEDAKFEERFDPIEAEKLRDDAQRWQLRVDRIEGELRRVLAELKADAPRVGRKTPAKKKASSAKKRGRRSARAPKARAAKRIQSVTKTRATSSTTSAVSRDSGSSDPAPSDPDPGRPPTAARTEIDASRAPLLERTREFWQQRTSRHLSLEDAREIIENSVAFIRLLNTWASKKAGKKKPTDPTLLGETDTSADGGSL